MDEGGVLFCSRTEVYFGLNRVGVRIWEQLPGPQSGDDRSIDDVVGTLQQSYPDVDRETLAEDVREFLGAMLESELVIDGQNA